jgi:ATP-binding cassette subfamily C protein CydD
LTADRDDDGERSRLRAYSPLSVLTGVAIFGERGAVLVAAIAAADRWPRLLAVAAVLGFALLGTRTVAAAFLRTNVEMALYSKTMSAVLHRNTGDIPDADIRMTLLRGVEVVARSASGMPQLVGDAAASIVACVWLGVSVHVSSVLLALPAAALAFGAAAAVRHTAATASDRYWTRFEGLVVLMQDGVAGRLELQAASESAAQHQRIRRKLDELRALARTSGLLEGVAGRVPVAVAIGAIVAELFLLRHWGVRLTTRDIILLGGALPAFAGLVTWSAQLARARGATRSVTSLLRAPARARGNEVPGSFDVSVDALTVRLSGREVLDRCSVRLDQGLAVITGANGAGKSTLLRVLSGLVEPSGGDVRIGGRPWKNLDWETTRRRFGYLAQRPFLPASDVRFAVRFLLGADTSDDEIRRALDRVGVLPVLVGRSPEAPLEAAVNELSAGERQRVAIARVPARDAELYLLDEPDANLDRAGIERLVDILKELSERATVVVAAHAPELVAIADHVIELDHGRVVRDEVRSPVSGPSRAGNRA